MVPARLRLERYRASSPPDPPSVASRCQESRRSGAAGRSWPSAARKLAYGQSARVRARRPGPPSCANAAGGDLCRRQLRSWRSAEAVRPVSAGWAGSSEIGSATALEPAQWRSVGGRGRTSSLWGVGPSSSAFAPFWPCREAFGVPFPSALRSVVMRGSSRRGHEASVRVALVCAAGDAWRSAMAVK